ncbi:hypothetical protein AWB69_06858 [Caballeronia udeis]|uniref:Uncharacterized protein n=1 Tax=Caballeronia udeis TaxID=1232866 RepID=A0A158IYB0_9BURK|nr:hypothetical protein [Caballeronia udeis]SAL61624.1 hypothetical protein AWB69_06858 [Caballeronia udeis]
MIKNAKTPTERAVSALHEFLMLVSKAPRHFVKDKELLQALRRQSRLGAYQNKAHGVIPTSRSSIERVCERLLPGGALEFDKLRKDALAELKTVARTLAEVPSAPKRTRDYYKQQSEDSNAKVVLGLVDCWHLTHALFEAIEAGRKIAGDTGDSALQEVWRKKEATIRSRLRLSKQLVATKGSDAEGWAETVRIL